MRDREAVFEQRCQWEDCQGDAFHRREPELGSVQSRVCWVARQYAETLLQN
jgi:hypothetical protein